MEKPFDFWTNLVILINEENSDDDDGDHRTVALVESHGRSWVEQASSPLFSKVPDLLKDSQIQSLTLILAPLICRSGPSVSFFSSYLTVLVKVSLFIAISINIQ